MKFQVDDDYKVIMIDLNDDDDDDDDDDGLI